MPIEQHEHRFGVGLFIYHVLVCHDVREERQDAHVVAEVFGRHVPAPRGNRQHMPCRVQVFQCFAHAGKERHAHSADAFKQAAIGCGGDVECLALGQVCQKGYGA